MKAKATQIITEESVDALLARIKSCDLCQQQLPLPAKPILQFGENSKILIAGQAPGKAAHDKGIPFDDISGDRLRAWLGVNRTQFYQTDNFALVPMGFCFPGNGKSGDLSPLPICAQVWRTQILSRLNQVELTLVLGKYAIDWHMCSKQTVTEQVKNWQTLLAANTLVLPHPSPRNNIWLKRNPWFEQQILPILKRKVSQVLK
ncbi:uracil-DNA glycosylase family protein [Colwelliaceae bacterium 6471]